MGNLGEKFAIFKSKYMQPKNIKTNPEKFELDLGDIATMLENRIEREERELYPLIGK